jgi:hypothetical protein
MIAHEFDGHGGHAPNCPGCLIPALVAEIARKDAEYAALQDRFLTVRDERNRLRDACTRKHALIERARVVLQKFCDSLDLSSAQADELRARLAELTAEAGKKENG